ncbi:MAG: acetyltransferase [Leptolyngbya sp. SIO4C1]|nr:acetyltransferase [Leptolyngbya sp. SIO4C1]
MFLKAKEDGVLVKVAQIEDAYDPMKDAVQGQIQAGQNEQPVETFKKADLIFPSGEPLPQCWTDANYQS